MTRPDTEVGGDATTLCAAGRTVRGWVASDERQRRRSASIGDQQSLTASPPSASHAPPGGATVDAVVAGHQVDSDQDVAAMAGDRDGSVPRIVIRLVHESPLTR